MPYHDASGYALNPPITGATICDNGIASTGDPICKLV